MHINTRKLTHKENNSLLAKVYIFFGIDSLILEDESVVEHLTAYNAGHVDHLIDHLSTQVTSSFDKH